MHIMRGIISGLLARMGGTCRYRNSAASLFNKAERIACGLMGKHITKNRAKPYQLQPWIGKGQMDGHRIIYAGIGINNDFICTHSGR